MKSPTITWLIEKVLRESDDFMSAPQIAKLVWPGQAISWQQRSTLHSCLVHLCRHKVVMEVEGAGERFYFALPAEMDTRATTFPLREEENKPRRPHKRRRRTDPPTD